MYFIHGNLNPIKKVNSFFVVQFECMVNADKNDMKSLIFGKNSELEAHFQKPSHHLSPLIFYICDCYDKRHGSPNVLSSHSKKRIFETPYSAIPL